MASGEQGSDVNGHTSRLFRESMANANIIMAPFPTGKDGRLDACYPSGVVTNQSIKMPSMRMSIKQIQVVPDTGSEAKAGARLNITFPLDRRALLLPYWGLAYTLVDDNTSSVTGTGICNGSWNIISRVQTFIDSIDIENIQDFNYLETFEVGMMRTDLASATQNSIKTNFEPQIREYPHHGIVKSANRIFNSVDTNTLDASRVWFIRNPITKLRHGFINNWLGKRIRIELDLAQAGDIAFGASSSTTAAQLPTYSVKNLRLLLYHCFGYDEMTINRFRATGFIGAVPYSIRNQFNWPASGTFNQKINLSTGCLNSITILPFRNTRRIENENKLADYVPGTTNNYDEVQFRIAGVNYPQQPMKLNADQVAEAYFQILGTCFIGYQCNPNLYQGGYTSPRILGALKASFGVHGGYESEYVGDGIPTLGGFNDINIRIERTADGVSTTMYIFLQSEGVLVMNMSEVDMVR